MGTFLPEVFGQAGGRAVTESIEKRKRDKAEKKEEDRLAATQEKEEDKRKLRLSIGAQAQIATSPRGVLGSPTTGRRRLSI